MRTRLTLMAVMFALLGFGLLSLFPSGLPAQEKIKFSSSVRLSPNYYLPPMAAKHKGIWERNGLNVEWISFGSGGAHYRAFAAGVTRIGASMVASDIRSAARGVPTIIVSNLQLRDNFSIWVSTKGRLRQPKDLKGTKLGVSRYGGTEHSYGQMVAKQLGLAEEVKFVSTGGIRESLAALQTGGIDGVVLTPSQMINLKLRGLVKELLSIADYRADPWGSFVVIAHTGFVSKEPATVRRVVRSVLQANRFIMSKEGKPWVMAKMKEMNRYSDKAANFIYDSMEFSLDGKLERKAIENVRSFMIEYKIIKAKEAPSIDDIYTDKFVR
ncbi:MAG: ABC transporter substrate-binding protein [Thermodesulfobacteriota bacterium]